jgi:putative ABC transport system ATP-binding protein
MAYITFENVVKSYKTGSVSFNAADGLDLEIEKGEFCVVCGPSGAGKTTMLNLLGGMDRADSGKITLDGVEISSLSKRKLVNYRRHDVGFVFQFYNIIQTLTALENVALAAEICDDPLSPEESLASVGLAERENYFPAQLSGGEQQRVAIARAIAKNPKILLCDEPVGALDYETGKNILKLLRETCEKTGKTVVLITHNTAITAMADRVIKIKNGKVISNEINESPVPAERIEW